MARPRKENADYFSHDADMRHDPKIKALRNKYGLAGYAVWCMMLEVLTDSAHFARMIDGLEMELLAGDFGISSEELEEMMGFMVKVRLLDKTEDNEFVSHKLQDRLVCVTQKRQRMRFVRDGVTQIPQSKVKETKGKESKEEQGADAPVKTREDLDAEDMEHIKLWWNGLAENHTWLNSIQEVTKERLKRTRHRRLSLKKVEIEEALKNAGDWIKGGSWLKFDWLMGSDDNMRKFLEGDYKAEGQSQQANKTEPSDIRWIE